MAVTTAVLSGNVTDITGALTSAYLKRVVVVIEANTDGSLLLDTDGDRIMAGPKRVTVDTSTGAYTVTLPKTNSTDIIPATGRLFRTRLTYPSGIPGAGNISLISGWWELTADGSLSDADKWDGLDVTVVSDALVQTIDDLLDAASVAWAKSPETIVTGTITRDSNGVVTSADVEWPDGTAGVFTTDTIGSLLTIDAYHITYLGDVTRTYTQPTITRDTNGAATSVPAIVVS